ncbi:MAG: PhoX family protein [Cytophaga sp.]|uniref:PhoX family protein n=1 Tax=Cytophaga sp. TaxID=29535 RepID=UPI003F7CF2E2
MKTYLLFAFIFFSTLPLFAQYPFKEIQFWDNTTTPLIDKKLSYNVLFKTGDTVYTNKGKWALAKGMHDMILVLPTQVINKLLLAVSHECNDSSSVTGDGGGMSIVPIEFRNNTWHVSDSIKNIDFTTVGGTYNNCSGTYVTRKSTILTAEEGTPSNNEVLYKKGKGYTDTSDFNGLKRCDNTGWMVEVDRYTNKALHKLYNMGRFVHESALVLDDYKTVFLTDDFAPSVFFKFVAKETYNFQEGQLYAYKEATASDTSHWIKLPMHMDSLLDIRNVALRMGASYFMRMEWMTLAGTKMYITATGYDNFSMESLYNGKPASYLLPFLKNNTIDQPYGSVLEFDLITNNIRVLINGGAGKKDPQKHFSNPDAITTVTKNDKTYLVIQEDIIANTRGRVSTASLAENLFVNEIYWLDLSIKNPAVDDLKRFLIAPNGAETTGGTFIEGDSRFYFVNIQHPDSKNPPPFNQSCTIVIDLKNK